MPRAKKRTSTGVCRQCRLQREVGHGEWHHAARVRCFACGGVLDRLTPRAGLVRHPDGVLRRRW
jgi:hypothetical protein